MTNKNSNTLEDNGFELLLHQAFSEINEEEQRKCEEIADSLGEIPTPKLDKALKRRKKHKTLLHYGITAAAVLLVLVGAHLTLYNSVEAYRYQFQRIFAQYNTGEGGFGSINTANSDDEAAILQGMVPAEGFPFSLWVPDDYHLEYINDFNVYQGYCEFKNDKDESISLDYVLHKNNSLGLQGTEGFQFDTEDSDVKDLDIHGNEGISVLRKEFNRIAFRIVWSDSNYMLHLYGSFEENSGDYEEILNKIAKTVAYTE